MSTILVVEDEEPISNILKFTLERDGFHVIQAWDGLQAMQLVNQAAPDLILLDVMLPEKDGFEVCREIRTFSLVPIIMLTARESEVDKVLGLEIGADDYVTKPFSSRELLARVKANLRRQAPDADSKTIDDGKRITLGEVIIDLNQYEVFKSGVAVPLTHREFELLTVLATRPGVVHTRDKLLQGVWGADYAGDDRTVDVTIRRLREKLEDDPSRPDYVLTKRGVGYYARR